MGMYCSSIKDKQIQYEINLLNNEINRIEKLVYINSETILKMNTNIELLINIQDTLLGYIEKNNKC